MGYGSATGHWLRVDALAGEDPAFASRVTRQQWNDAIMAALPEANPVKLQRHA